MCNNKDAGHITKQHVNVRMLEPLSKEPNESKDWIVVVAAVQLLVHSLHEFTKESFRPIARSSLQPRETQTKRRYFSFITQCSFLVAICILLHY